LSSLEAHATTSAPRSFASSTLPVPTPPLAPRISTLSPFLIVSCVTIMRCAVP
jgi:hypothetical protein